MQVFVTCWGFTILGAMRHGVSEQVGTQESWGRGQEPGQGSGVWWGCCDQPWRGQEGGGRRGWGKAGAAGGCAGWGVTINLCQARADEEEAGGSLGSTQQGREQRFQLGHPRCLALGDDSFLRSSGVLSAKEEECLPSTEVGVHVKSPVWEQRLMGAFLSCPEAHLLIDLPTATLPSRASQADPCPRAFGTATSSLTAWSKGNCLPTQALWNCPLG